MVDSNFFHGPIEFEITSQLYLVFTYDCLLRYKDLQMYCFSWNKQVSHVDSWNFQTFLILGLPYLLTLPLCVGVSRVRALSPAWTGSPPRETLISHTHLFLPHDLPPTKKSRTIKSWPTFCNQYFWKFPIWNSRTDEKRREIRMVKLFKWYPVIDLFDTFTGKLGHGD